MRYNRLSEYLTKEGYVIFFHIFTWQDCKKNFEVTICIDDINIVGTPEEIPKGVNFLEINLDERYWTNNVLPYVANCAPK